MSPFRIAVQGSCATPLEKWRENAAANAHHPRIEARTARGALAIVGGGPSLAESLEELRTFEGDIWAINDTATWLTRQGIACALFTVDANQRTGEAREAVLAAVCDPALAEHFAGRLRVFDVHEVIEGAFFGGSSSATRAPAVAFVMGYTSVSFFGCEGSFAGEAHHVYDSDMSDAQLIVRAGGTDYRTNLQFFVQSQELACLATLDGFIRIRSGGLLKAMIDHPDTWEVVAVSAALKKNLERDGPTGIFDEPYPVAA